MKQMLNTLNISDFISKCDRILENLPFGHKLTFWENSNENFNNTF